MLDMNEKTRLVDCHVHTSGVSTCCRLNASRIVDEAVGAGIDGIILTNHYALSYIEKKHIYETLPDMARAHVEEFRRVRAIGEEKGLLVMFGVELTMEQYGGTHLLIKIWPLSRSYRISRSPPSR